MGNQISLCRARPAEEVITGITTLHRRLLFPSLRELFGWCFDTELLPSSFDTVPWRLRCGRLVYFWLLLAGGVLYHVFSGARRCLFHCGFYSNTAFFPLHGEPIDESNYPSLIVVHHGYFNYPHRFNESLPPPSINGPDRRIRAYPQDRLSSRCETRWGVVTPI